MLPPFRLRCNRRASEIEKEGQKMKRRTQQMETPMKMIWIRSQPIGGRSSGPEAPF
jgi:hypothetical protein